MRRFVKRTVVVGTVVAIGSGGAAAWAVWAAHGSGSAGSQAGHAVQLTTIATTTTGTLLYPGRSGDLKVNVRNDNPYPIQINTVAAQGAAVADDAHRTAGCVGTATGVTVDAINIVPWPIGRNVTQEFTLTGAVHMSNASASACQGAAFTIPILLIGNSTA